MMMWRSLSGRTICQAADAVAARRGAKAKPAATDGAHPTAAADSVKSVTALLPGGPAGHGPDAS